VLLPAQTALSQARYATISQASQPPTIDGVLSDGEWDTASVIDNLHQVQPVEFAEPSQRTVWYIKFDAENIYLAAHAFDSEPGKIVAQTLRQGGSTGGDDSMFVIIDAFNNKRSGYRFSLNPNGVREDAIFATATRASDDWDGIWRGAAAIVSDGWTMEMAIPFKTLSFPKDSPIWGFNFGREIPRLAEHMAWSSRNGQVNPTVSGEVMGFRDLTQGVGLDVIPSLSSTSVQNHDTDDSDSEARPSLDINYKLTPAINMVLTLNTDFAATEVDTRQLDVSRFSLFFPEKRSFFLTDFDIFQFGGISTGRGGGGGGGSLVGSASGSNGLPFFSRRIGLGPDRQPVDLTAGLKLSGRIGDTDFGTLYVRQDEFEDIDASDLYVARVSHGVLEESSAGAIFTHGDPTSNESSSLAGVDFNYRNNRLANNRSMEGQFWVQKSSNVDVSGDDWAYSAALAMPTREGWEAGLQLHEAQENYRPALGFANRTGVRLYSGRIGHKWVSEDSRAFQRVNSSVEYDHWEYLDTGLIQSERLNFNLVNVSTSSGDFWRVEYSKHKERLLVGEQPLDELGIIIPAGEYSFNKYAMFFRTAGHRKWALEMRYDDGDYYNGERFHLRSEVEWRPNRHLAFQFEYDYNKYDFPDAEAITRQITFDSQIAFNAKWALLTLAQYDNLSNDIGINMRLRYNRAAGQDFWVVLNHNMREYEQGDPEYRGSGFRSIQTIAAVKVRYTFRF